MGVAGGLVSSNADIIPADPLFIEWASWLASAGMGVGEWLVSLKSESFALFPFLPAPPAARAEAAGDADVAETRRELERRHESRRQRRQRPDLYRHGRAVRRYADG